MNGNARHFSSKVFDLAESLVVMFAKRIEHHHAHRYVVDFGLLQGTPIKMTQFTALTYA